MSAASPALPHFDVAAGELREREFSRLASAVVPTVDALRLLSGKQIRERAAAMLERLGYELLTLDTATDLVITKDGKKYVVAFAPPTDLEPTATGHLTRLHSVVVAGNADAGFLSRRAVSHATPKPTPRPLPSSWWTGRS